MDAIFSIKDLLMKESTNIQVDSFAIPSGPLFGEEEYLVTVPLQGELHMVLADDVILARATLVGGSIELPCFRCGKAVIHRFDGETTKEREFFLEKPETYEGEEIEDAFGVDLERQEIDASEFLRQELLLMMPDLSCPKECTEAPKKASKEDDTFHPFKDLKGLMDDSK